MLAARSDLPFIPFTEEKALIIVEQALDEDKLHDHSLETYFYGYLFISNLCTAPSSHAVLSPFLKTVLEGFARTTARGSTCRARHALTADELFTLQTFTEANPTLENLRAFAVVFAGMFGHLRASSIWQISAEDVTFSDFRLGIPYAVSIHVRFAKRLTHPHVLWVSMSDTFAVPWAGNHVHLFYRYCRSVPPAGLLFQRTFRSEPALLPGQARRNLTTADPSAAPLITQIVNAFFLRARLPRPEGLSSHLFRRGSVSIAAAIGVDLAKLAQRGRWSQTETMSAYLLHSFPSTPLSHHYFGFLLPGAFARVNGSARSL